MKVKFDENLGRRESEQFSGAGYDVMTVLEQGMQGFTDRDLIAACADEGRCLVTLDLDFSNPFVFQPDKYKVVCVNILHSIH